jgi:hypothetical protein
MRISINHTLFICVLISSFSKMLFWLFMLFRRRFSNSSWDSSWLHFLVLLFLGFFDVLLLNVNQFDGLRCINSSSKIIDIKTTWILLDLNLVITSSQLLQHIPKTLFVMKVLRINHGLPVFIVYFVQFHLCFLETRATTREHTLRVKLSTNVSTYRWLFMV